MALFETLTIIGLCLSLILGIFNLWKLKRNRVNLNVELKQIKFDSESTSDYDQKIEETIISLEADIKNKGLEPTSISKVTMELDYKKIKGEMFTQWNPREFFNIRLEPNDRKSQMLHIKYPLFIPKEIKEVNATVKIYTTYKDIVKEIKLIKREVI